MIPNGRILGPHEPCLHHSRDVREYHPPLHHRLPVKGRLCQHDVGPWLVCIERKHQPVDQYLKVWRSTSQEGDKVLPGFRGVVDRLSQKKRVTIKGYKDEQMDPFPISSSWFLY